ncbi:MAG: hypothetical protein IKP36_06520 [Bacteroidaceae bacterium]|nr:hypothetical protein [Bacteroidaceae bacterium]
MKKIKLFLAAVAAMVGMGASAQLTDGTVYWLQDTNTKQFISQGANWGTQATVQEVGGLGAQAVYVSDGVYKLKNIMWNKVNTADLGLRTSDRFWDQAAGEVTLEAVEGGYKLNTPSGYLCNNGDVNGDGVKRLGSTTNAEEATVWNFLTKSEYDAAIQAYKDGKAATYASNLGYNSVSSVSELEALITDVNHFISKDYTNSITNPTLSSNWNGWSHAAASGSNRSQGDAVGSGCAEFWNGCGAANQTVSNLPTGLYKVEFVGTFRPSGSGNAEKCASEFTSSPAFVYANDAQVEFLHWIDVPAKANGRSGITVANGYNNTLYTYVTDGTLKIGIVQGCWENGNMWCPFGQFRLTYYSDQVADEDISALVATIPAEGTIPTSVYSNLTTLKNTLESAKTIAAFNALSEAITNANTLVSYYTAFLYAKEDAEIVGVAAATINEQTVAANAATTSAEIEAATTALHTAVVAAAAELDYFDITTFTITNASPYANGNNWTATNGTRLSEWASNPVTYDADNKCAEMWNNTSASMLYTITNLPAGRYRLTAIAGARDNSGGVLKVGDKTIELVSVGSVNSRAQAGEWFDNGGGVNELFFNLDATATELTIGLVAGTSGDAWTLWRSFKLETLDESIAAGYLAPGYATLLESAQATLNDAAYVNVTGDERTALATAVAANPSTVAEYEAAVEALNNAIAAFTAAKTNYDIYATEKALADAISTDIAGNAPTTADEALAAFKTLKVAEYNYVATAYPFSATSKIGEFSTWERTGTVSGKTKNEFEALTSQHWSGTEMTYYEQPAGGWDANAWTANYTKTTTLPAGSYVIKVAARAATGTGTTAKITCSAATLDGPIFNFGDTGKGITTSGVASFDEGVFCNDGNGRGWVWNYLPFTLTEETEVTMTVVAEANGTHQWFSVCDGELLSMTNIATAVAYDEAIANTIENVDVANVTMTRTIKEGFNTVVLPFDLTAGQVAAAFGTGTEVYAFSEDGAENADEISINFNKVVAGTITANVPVLVKATQASKEQEFKGVQVVAPTEGAIVQGTNASFVGVFGPTTIGEGHFFIGDGALYKSAGRTNINAFRAYILLKNPNTTNGVKLFVGGEEVATGISTIENGQLTIDNAPIYNLAGQRIQKMQKGINIVNGRKVLY